MFDVIIVGGSYSGLSAAMSLGRARKRVLVIDSGMSCNRSTPHSHNFLTRDGDTPQQIATLAREQVLQYLTITLLNDLAIEGSQNGLAFDIKTASGDTFGARKLIFATGIRDLLPDIPGLADCWGKTVVHCPYCHGYEVKDQKTGILANGDMAFDLSKLISNWTGDLTLYTNGPSTLSPEQHQLLTTRWIKIDEREFERIEHINGKIKKIHFKDGGRVASSVLYARAPFEQHCKIPEQFGCELNEMGFLKTSAMYETTVRGVYACGDNASPMRSVANAVGTGSATGAIVSKQLIFDDF